MAPPSNPPSQLPPEVLAALRSGNVVEAIKLLRKSHPRMGLSEAKALLDAMQKLAVKPQHASAPKPPQVAAPKHPHAPAYKPSVAPDPSAPFIAQPGLSPGEVPRSSGLGKYGWIPALMLLGIGVFIWASFSAMTNTENKAAGESIAAAVQSFKEMNGRYPAQLEQLVPAFLPELPKAGKYFYILYAAEPGGAQCWVAYQVHRDRYVEYDCRKQVWINVEIEDSEVFRRPDAQRIVPEMHQVR